MKLYACDRMRRQAAITMQTARKNLKVLYEQANDIAGLASLHEKQNDQVATLLAERMFINKPQKDVQKIGMLINSVQLYGLIDVLDTVPIIIEDPSLVDFCLLEPMNSIRPFESFTNTFVLVLELPKYIYVKPVVNKEAKPYPYDLVIMSFTPGHSYQDLKDKEAGKTAANDRKVMMLLLANSRREDVVSTHFTSEKADEVVRDKGLLLNGKLVTSFSAETANAFLDCFSLLRAINQDNPYIIQKIVNRPKPSASIPFCERRYFRKLMLLSMVKEEEWRRLDATAAQG